MRSLLCCILIAGSIIGCGGDESPVEGSADIAKSNPAAGELTPEQQQLQSEKMRRGGHDPNNPLGRGR